MIGNSDVDVKTEVVDTISVYVMVEASAVVVVHVVVADIVSVAVTVEL